MTKASILLPNRHNFRHDRATIVVPILRRSPADRLETTPQRKNCDRGSIAARSDRDRGFYHALSAPSNIVPGERMIVINLIPYTTIIGNVCRQPSDDLLIASRRKIGRSWRYHVAIAYPSDSSHLTSISRTCCKSDRVDSSPRDRRLAIVVDWI